MSPNEPTEGQIRTRAYEIYLRRGAQPGHERDDWLQAEYELRQRPTGRTEDPKSPKRGKTRRA